MIIVEINEGLKIPYSESGTRVTLNDDITINLASREKDWPVHIDVCHNADGELVIGAASGRAYVAQFDIPARQYEEPAAPVGDEEPTPPVPIPLDMSTVTMTLWSIE